MTLHQGDAKALLPDFEPPQPVDFVFVDAIKRESRQYFDLLEPRLASRAVIVTDNTSTHTQELADFVGYVRGLPGSRSCGIPVGNGIELTLLERASS